MEHTFIGLGGNMGEVKVNFEKAIGKIEELIGPVIRKSSLYKTEPWGRKDQDPFLNMVIEVAT
ncbi:MAG: 2-amino-4-hydroxy-6-hydroxymethyldihydropteridine diphosphokinase, partial [Bacteroidota bacterium]|nr:2-amino-4-hydroxy-6-hydroxymethyldihydropteridine diphosphokinase [Bacteroidota bacterium]